MQRQPPVFMQTLKLALTASVLLGSLTSQRGVHADSFLGIKVKAPSRWTYLGNSGDRGALRALYASPRSYASKAQRGVAHTPTMRILWFPKPTGEAKEKPEESQWPMLTPYTSTKDYIERVYVGLKQVSVAVGAVGKMKGRRYVTAGKGNAGQELTLHIATGSFDDGEFAIEYECLTEQYRKLKSQFEKSLLTLTAITRKPAAETEIPMWTADREAWVKQSAAARSKVRDTWAKQWLATRKATAAPGWKTHKTKNYTVLSHADTKFTKRAVKATEVIRDWVDGWIGETTDETVMPAVIRIYANRAELAAYRSRDINPLEFDPAVREIYVFKDASVGNTGAGFGSLIRGIFEHALYDKHPYAKKNLPRWLANGLWGYMDSSKLKGKKLVFFPHEVEIGRFAYHKQRDNKTLLWIWDLIQERSIKGPKDGANEDPWGYTPECSRLLRWFDDGGSALFDKPRFLPAYLKQVGDSAVVEPADLGAQVDQRRLDSNQIKELNKLIYDRRDKLVDKINYAVIPLSVDAWKKADAAFKVYSDNFKL
jgi:hypothetical protein